MSQYRFVFLRANSRAIKKRLTDEGFRVCPCASFGSRYLNAFKDKNGISIHGIGYKSEMDYFKAKTQKQILDCVIQEELEHKRIIVDCGKDVDKFIQEAKKDFLVGA